MPCQNASVGSKHYSAMDFMHSVINTMSSNIRCKHCLYNPHNTGSLHVKYLPSECMEDAIAAHAPRLAAAIRNDTWKPLPEEVLTSPEWLSYEEQLAACTAFQNKLDRSGIGGRVDPYEGRLAVKLPSC